MSESSRSGLLPFRPVPFVTDDLSDELFIAANYAIAFLHSASLLKGLHWNDDDHGIAAGCIADATKFVLAFALKCQNAIRPVSQELTQVRPNGPFSIGEFSEENAHWVAYRIGVAAQSRLSKCLPLSVQYQLRSEDNSSLVAAILKGWDSCKEALAAWEMPDENRVEAEIKWEARQAEKKRRETSTANVHAKVTAKKAGQRGRKIESDPKQDERIHDGWKESNCRSFEEYAAVCGHSAREIERAVDRHKKRLRKKPPE